jgi:hypothetical protein
MGIGSRGKIKHFRQLEAWQEAHRLVLMVYKATQKFPADERFGLVTQMRRDEVPNSPGAATPTP